ncbi:hypothetical protein DFS30_02355 [Akkermansia muciniphila]|nr:hypothetical protein CUC06_02290 [Akkermansia muciniphila]PNC73466.1 hypothetical protein CXU04_04870 [Akkermansia muciniphila]PNC77328.1 hypothetical protein CXT98_09615 [Akkermansia muciniphila]PNC90260.1 hypothetical protein CXU03_01590 [Akkermansia muciniphila]QAA38241.1 hypothetical protein C1I90_02610 [Akkermansia muciniphila]
MSIQTGDGTEPSGDDIVADFRKQAFSPGAAIGMGLQSSCRFQYVPHIAGSEDAAMPDRLFDPLAVAAKYGIFPAC